MTEKFLDKAYTARTPDAVEALYDDWSASYEAEVGENGYATPKRTAEALAQVAGDLSLPILDYGCGTGLSGLALKAAGFQIIDGADPSAEMLAKAKEKGLYRSLTQIEPSTEITLDTSGYAALTAIGVIGAGAAPIALFDSLMGALGPGGHLALSFNDHALENPESEATLMAWVEDGRATLAFKEYGDHLPGIGLGSNVYVLTRT